ncbi:DUF7536 family protein [Natronomonas sp. EA1]|uniref:DUF7536 family protein n=1 Tax=Natronomonas sp. EA1 TaxID=3421655 RepID=UPI003EB6B915
MSADTPERPGTARFLAALNVARNAKLGFGIGVLLAAVLVAAVLQSPPDPSVPTVFYVGLGFVLATGVGLLLTAVFTVASAVRLARAS